MVYICGGVGGRHIATLNMVNLTQATTLMCVRIVEGISNYRTICGVRVGYLLLICESIKVKSKFSLNPAKDRANGKS